MNDKQVTSPSEKARKHVQMIGNESFENILMGGTSVLLAALRSKNKGKNNNLVWVATKSLLSNESGF